MEHPQALCPHRRRPYGTGDDYNGLGLKTINQTHYMPSLLPNKNNGHVTQWPDGELMGQVKVATKPYNLDVTSKLYTRHDICVKPRARYIIIMHSKQVYLNNIIKAKNRSVVKQIEAISINLFCYITNSEIKIVYH